MTIVLCGGGSGGHITPLLAVAAELRKQHKDVRLIYIGERKGKFKHIAEDSRLFDELHFISAGKLRRYHSESLLRQLLDFKTIFLNLRDIIRIFIGIAESFWILGKLKPNAIFLKGGFVCVPVAVSAHLHRLPYITHDSDALPGLSNRIAGRWAKYHAVAMPAKYYSYPDKTIRVVGVPSNKGFRAYSASEQRLLKEKFKINQDAQVLLVTGGSNGARRLNEAMICIMPRLLRENPNLYIFHQIGAGNEDQIKPFEALNETGHDRVQFFDFTPELFHLSAIADVIVTRAGASAVADFGAQRKACIIVPNPYLTGGHQLKNAKVFEDARAGIIVAEKDMVAGKSNLYNTITRLLSEENTRTELGNNLHNLAPDTDAATSLAKLLFEVAK